jgi:hypothetical protein
MFDNSMASIIENMGLFDEVKLLHSPLSPITELYRNR